MRDYANSWLQLKEKQNPAFLLSVLASSSSLAFLFPVLVPLPSPPHPTPEVILIPGNELQHVIVSRISYTIIGCIIIFPASITGEVYMDSAQHCTQMA